jgi:hypothetical protein
MPFFIWSSLRLAEEFGKLRPGPTREELNHTLNLPQLNPQFRSSFVSP